MTFGVEARILTRIDDVLAAEDSRDYTNDWLII
jgi:hypothetical protein